MPHIIMSEEDSDGRPFRCEPKLYVYHEKFERFQIETGFIMKRVELECKWETIEFKTETIMEFEEPELTPYGQAVEGTYNYFIGIGCEGLRRCRGSTPIIRLPGGVDEWSIDVNGDLLVVEKVAPNTNGRAATVAKRFQVPLADPESFPKILAHLQKHTKFLRGGTNANRFIPKAD